MCRCFGICVFLRFRVNVWVLGFGVFIVWFSYWGVALNLTREWDSDWIFKMLISPQSQQEAVCISRQSSLSW